MAPGSAVEHQLPLQMPSFGERTLLAAKENVQISNVKEMPHPFQLKSDHALSKASMNLLGSVHTRNAVTSKSGSNGKVPAAHSDR